VPTTTAFSLIDANEAYLADSSHRARAIEQTKKGAVQAAIDGLKSGFNDDNEERTGSDILEDIVVGAVWSALKQGWTISRERQAAAQTAKQRLTDKTNAVLGSAVEIHLARLPVLPVHQLPGLQRR